MSAWVRVKCKRRWCEWERDGECEHVGEGVGEMLANFGSELRIKRYDMSCEWIVRCGCG